MIICSICGREEARGVVVFGSDGKTAEYCKFHEPRAFRDKAKDIWADGFTLQHVRGDDGKPVTVHSTKELREVEKKHNVALAIMSDNDVSKPPVHEPWAGNIAHKYKKKFNRDPDAYRPENVTGVSAGVVKSSADTLVDHPRPLGGPRE